MTDLIDQARTYTDFRGFGALRRGAKDNSPEALHAVAQQFEAMFVHMLLKGSRDSQLAEDVLGGGKNDTYNDLYDQQMAQELSHQRGIGLADMIVKQLGGRQSSVPGVAAIGPNVPHRRGIDAYSSATSFTKSTLDALE